MKLNKVLAIAATLAGLAGVGQAQTSADRPIRIVVPYAPGGTTDVVVRVLQPTLSKSTGQSVIIDNRPGGASVIGTNIVAKATPDGHTLLAGDTALFVNPSLMQGKLPYDTEKEFRGVTMLTRAPLFLIVNASSPFKDLGELIAHAKANPGRLTYSSGGNGTSPHMVGEMFKIAAGIDILHIPYQGAAPAVRALLAGEVDMYFGGSSAAPQITAGKMRALSVAGTGRDQFLPEVPTFHELGIKGMEEGFTYWGLFAPAATPDDRVASLSSYLHQAMKEPAYLDMLKARGLTAVPNDPDAHTRQFKQMINDWRTIVERGNIRGG